MQDTTAVRWAVVIFCALAAGLHLAYPKVVVDNVTVWLVTTALTAFSGPALKNAVLYLRGARPELIEAEAERLLRERTAKG